MKRLLIVVVYIIVSGFILAQTRQPAVAGKWYPDDANKLKQMLSGIFADVEVKQSDLAPLGLVSPHAGFIYSGKVAAHGFSQLENEAYDTVILIGSSHHYLNDLVSIYDGDSAKTPLGNIPIDKNITKRLLQADERFVFSSKIHSPEHSLEAQLPFLQYQLNDFKIVLILTSTRDFALLQKLSQSLVEISLETNKKLLFVCSSDMSHFHNYKFASAMDKRTCDLIINKQWQQLQQDIFRGKCELCGYYGLYVFLQVMESLNAADPILLKYANSGDVTGDKTKVVGYCSIVFPEKENEKEIEEETMNEEQKKYLLDLARSSIEYYLQNRQELVIDQPQDSDFLKELAVFVTLNKNNNLRGCIGHMQARMALYKAVIQMAVGAAFEDPRFPPVRTEEELENIDIEISILSPMERIFDYKQIRLGIDGVWIKKGFSSGVFLPQVATETGWSLDEFLGNLCAHKAGLPYDAYKNPDTEIYIYQVEKFEEE